MSDSKRNEFEKAAAQEHDGNLVGEFLSFLGNNKKWWLLPIIVILLALGVLMLLAGTGAAPFIYTLF